MKGSIHIDYLIAAGIFFLIFVFTINFLTDYLATTKETSSIAELRSRALGLLGMADRSFSEPGLQSDAYRFYILLNNTADNLINQSSAVDLTDELVEFDLSLLGSFDVNSIAIHYNGICLPYNRSGSVVRFATAIAANQSKWFAVYLDDDSNFTDNSVPISYSNNVSERIYPLERVSLLQYRKIEELGNSDYSIISANVGEFYLTIYDSSGNKFFGYGGYVPRKGDVIALERYVIYQNSTAGIESGRMVIQTW
jgi:hypothetical protein